MATVTPNIGLTLPAGNEKVSRQTINDNMTIIDTAFGNAHDSSVDSMQAGLSNVVDGDTTDEAIPAGAYAYIKNNEHGLSEGYYQNTSGSAFPASGGTADSTVFTPVSTAGILNSLNNKFTQILAPTSFVNYTNVQLSDSIENYDEVYVEIYLNTSTGKRSACSTIPVLAIKNNVYAEGNQYVISGIGSVAVSSTQLTYCLYAQVSFKDATTFHMEYCSKTGWSGTMYVQIYAK